MRVCPVCPVTLIGGPLQGSPSPWCGRTATWLSAPTAASPSPMGLSRVRSTSYTLRAPQPGPWWCPPTPNSRGMVLADQGIHQTCCSLGRGLCPGPDLRVCRGPRNQLQAGHPWRGDPWATLHASREMAWGQLMGRHHPGTLGFRAMSKGGGQGPLPCASNDAS